MRAVGIREGVALGRGRATDAVQFGLVQPRRVADIVQTRRLGDLPVEQRQDVAGAGERADVRHRLPREAVWKSLVNPAGRFAAGRCTLFSLASWLRGYAPWFCFQACVGCKRNGPGAAVSGSENDTRSGVDHFHPSA